MFGSSTESAAVTLHDSTHDERSSLASACESLSVTFLNIEPLFHDDFQPKALGSAV